MTIFLPIDIVSWFVVPPKENLIKITWRYKKIAWHGFASIG